MLFNSYSYEILYEQFHRIYLQGEIKLLLVTVNNRLKFEIEIVHDHLSCHAKRIWLNVSRQSRPSPTDDVTTSGLVSAYKYDTSSASVSTQLNVDKDAAQFTLISRRAPQTRERILKPKCMTSINHETHNSAFNISYIGVCSSLWG